MCFSSYQLLVPPVGGHTRSIYSCHQISRSVGTSFGVYLSDRYVVNNLSKHTYKSGQSLSTTLNMKSKQFRGWAVSECVCCVVIFCVDLWMGPFIFYMDLWMGPFILCMDLWMGPFILSMDLWMGPSFSAWTFGPGPQMRPRTAEFTSSLSGKQLHRSVHVYRTLTQ